MNDFSAPAESESRSNDADVPDKGSPEYKIYYYRRHKEACYKQMQLVQQVEPKSLVVLIWNNLDEQGRQNLLQLGMKFIMFRPDVDLDDLETMNAMAMAIITEISYILKTKTPKKTKKAAKVSNGHTLLRTTLLNQHSAAIKDSPRTPSQYSVISP